MSSPGPSMGDPERDRAAGDDIAAAASGARDGFVARRLGGGLGDDRPVPVGRRAPGAEGDGVHHQVGPDAQASTRHGLAEVPDNAGSAMLVSSEIGTSSSGTNHSSARRGMTSRST